MASEGYSYLTHDLARKMWPLDGWDFPCDPQLYECNTVQSKLCWSTQQDCCTSTILRPASCEKLFTPTTQLKQTNPQPNPNTILWRVIIVNIYMGQYKKYGPLGGSRSRGICFLNQLLSIYSAHFILCYFWLLEFQKSMFCSFGVEPYYS